MVFWRKNKKIQRSQGASPMRPNGFTPLEFFKNFIGAKQNNQKTLLGFTPLEFFKNFIGAKQNNQKTLTGFTLIELLVAMATFVVVVVAVTDIFLVGLGGSKRIFGQQNIQESGRFIMESMSKEIRMSKINTVAGSSNVLNITNSKSQTFNYSFDADKIIRRGAEALNPNEVELTGNFYIRKDSPDSQPRVTIVMTLKNRTNKAGEQSEINLQTTISSRHYVQ